MTGPETARSSEKPPDAPRKGCHARIAARTGKPRESASPADGAHGGLARPAAGENAPNRGDKTAKAWRTVRPTETMAISPCPYAAR